jgi:acetoacetyl-CoA synthetase
VTSDAQAADVPASFPPSDNPPVGDTVRLGDLLWTPSPARIADSNVTKYLGWLKDTRGLDFPGYRELWQWSITETEAFWQSIWDYNDIVSETRPTAALGSAGMPGAQWFPGARLNYAEHVLRNERPGEVALYFHSETIPVTPLLWDDLAPKVRILATRLRELGVRPGDRVASVLPNVPEAVIAMLATTAIGAIWTSVSPDFGWRGVLDRFRQLQPKVLIATGGYAYGGKDYDRSEELAAIIDDLGPLGLEPVIYLPFKDVAAPYRPAPYPLPIGWDDLLRVPPADIPAHQFHQGPWGMPVPGAADFQFHRGPFDAPLWILFSSGTTGLPKAITHSHGGILLEQLKLQRLNMDLNPGDVLFFFTTTGWMMWNFMVSSLIIGVRPLLYDGNPNYPAPDTLWRMAAEARVTLFGASPAYVDTQSKRGIVP